MGSQRVGHEWATELNLNDSFKSYIIVYDLFLVYYCVWYNIAVLLHWFAHECLVVPFLEKPFFSPMNCFCTLVENQDEECTYDEVWNFVKSLFHIYWDDLVIFVIHSIKTDAFTKYWIYFPMLYSGSLPIICFMRSSVYMLIPNY